MTVGIVGYGAYVPSFRIKVEEIARVWHTDPASIRDGLNVMEKAVPDADEDAATIAVEAARRALVSAGISGDKIEAIYVGSESHPYAVKPTATIVAKAISSNPRLMAADLEFACKAGTAGIQILLGFAKSGMIRYGMSIGADTSQGRPGDALEYTTGAGGAAYIIGNAKGEVIAEITNTASYTTDTPDFWRRDGAEFPSHSGRFTGEPAYFKHVVGATELILKDTGMKPSDFAYAVFHQPNGKFPINVAKQLGFEMKQIEQGLLVPLIGNTYSGSSLLGLAAVLDVAKPGDKVLVTSFGSGAGSDSFVLEIKEPIEKKRARTVPVRQMISTGKIYVDYAMYLKNKGFIVK
ncbi:MAG: hydroxymethylglutaryl-CoA synthase [Candidatus Micrarchaeia archaeon]